MRIALVSEHASPLAAIGGVDSGGQNVYVANLARQLGRAGHQVDVFTRTDDPALAPVVSFDRNVNVVHIDAGPRRRVEKEKLLPYMHEFAVRMLMHCAQRSYNVVHANFFMSGLVAAQLQERLKLPFVITFHALGKVRRQHQREADRFPLERIGIEERLVRCADRIVAECPQDREDLIKLYGAPVHKIDLVSCGIDADELSAGAESARAQLGLRDDDFVVLQLGRLVPRKGIDNVIRGVGALKRTHGIAAKLMIVGGDHSVPDPVRTPEIARLAKIATEEGIADSVGFVGQRARHELKHYYSAADVFVSTPWYEPFGITPLEAMACGTPVIGAAVGGIKYSVVDGVTGYLVPPRAPEALAARLAHLYRNPELARAMGRAGIRHVRARFTWDKVARDMQRVYAIVANEDRLYASQSASPR